MFCPKCARPAADAVQFCQQCGQQLGEVRKLLGEGGAAEVAAGGRAKRAARLRDREGVRQGFKLSLLALLVLPFFPLVQALFGELIPSAENTRLDELPLELFGTFVFVLFVAGLARMLYAALFEGKAEQVGAEQGKGEQGAAPGRPAEELSGARDRHALPPSHSIPAADFASRRVSTADLAAAPRRSVTEHTTRGLRRE